MRERISKNEKVSRTLDTNPKAPKQLSLEELFRQDKEMSQTDIRTQGIVQRTIYINENGAVPLRFIRGGLADKIRSSMPEIPEETIPGIIEVLVALTESGTEIRMYTNLRTLIGDIWKGRTAEEIIQDQVTINQAMTEAEAYRQKTREEKKIRKKVPSTKVVEVDEEDETQEAVEEEGLIRTWKSSDKFKGTKGSNTYEGSEIGGYGRQGIRGIRIKCMEDKQNRGYEMIVSASTKLHKGDPRDRFYLAFLHTCIENWDKDVAEEFQDIEGRKITRIS